METTTQNIIKMLPFDEDFKIQLLENFDIFTQDQKHEIENIVWNLYMKLHDLKLQENTLLAMERVKNNEEKIDEDFYTRIKEKTEKDMEQNLYAQTETVDLSAARAAMEKI